MIKVLISTRSQLEIEEDVEWEIDQQANIQELFNQYKEQVNVSEFDRDSSLEFRNLSFEQVAVVSEKQPFVILESGKKLRDIEKAEKMSMIIYLPSPSEPIIICQSGNIQSIIWDYRNMKPLINTLEGDPVMKKLVSKILKVAINNKMHQWNDVKNKTMRSLMEGKLGTLIRLKLDARFEVEEEGRSKIEGDHKQPQMMMDKPSGEQKKLNQMKQKGSIPSVEGKNISDKNSLANPEPKSLQSHNLIIKPSEYKQINSSSSSKRFMDQNKKPINKIQISVISSQGSNEAGIDIRDPPDQPALRIPEQDHHAQGKKVEQIYIRQNLVSKEEEQIKPIIVQNVQSKKIEEKQTQKDNKIQDNKQVNINNAVSVPSAPGELTLVIGFQPIYSQSSGRKQISQQVSKAQCLSDLLPSIIKQLKQKGFDWADDSYDPIRDKKKISITYEGNQFHKITKVFKSLINSSTKQIAFNITRHYEGG